MVHSRKSITIHYRKLDDITNSFNGNSLQQAMVMAMGSNIDGIKIRDNWKHRSYRLPRRPEYNIFINHNEIGEDNCFGDLTLYSHGYIQPLLENTDDAPILPLSQISAPKGSEYVSSIMYWMIKDNHVFLIQSQSIRGRIIEDYLTWLFKEKSGVTDQNTNVLLDSTFDTNVVGADLEDISRIEIGGLSVSSQTDVSQPRDRITEGETYHQVDSRRSMGEKAERILEIILDNETDIRNLKRNLPEGAVLDVGVNIGFKSKYRKIAPAAMSSLLRNLPEEEVVAFGKDGRIKGNSITLKYNANAQFTGSLLDITDAQRCLNEAYENFVSNGRIEP